MSRTESDRSVSTKESSMQQTQIGGVSGDLGREA